jgi:endonuclease/exonuclease/phosphatase family metal-dependent hydrolase
MISPSVLAQNPLPARMVQNNRRTTRTSTRTTQGHTRNGPNPTNTHRHASVLNPANERENIDMGDSLHEILLAASEPIEDSNLRASEEWQRQTIRLYFQNVNGLRVHDSGADIIEAFLNLHEIQADIFGIVETQLHCRSSKVQAMLHECKRRVWTHAKIYSSSSDEEWTDTRKPGGTLLGITGPLVGRVKTHAADKYGRWTRVDLLGRSGRIVTVICAYQVVQEVGRHGDRTNYSQQVRMMRMEGSLHPDPRRKFIEDMKVLVTELRNKDHDVILMGDFNESIGVDPTGMASVMTAGLLSDVFCHKHGLHQEKPTYARGTTRVDYVLSTPRLLNHVRHTGAEPFNFRIFSDHRGLFVDFSMPGFFDRAPNALAKLHTRHLIYDCPRHVKQYLSATAQYFQDHKVEERMIALSQGPRNDEAAEALDRDITRGMLSAELKCKSTARSPWSKELHAATTRLHILKRVLSQWRTGLDGTIAITMKQSKLDTPIVIPTSLQDIQRALREAQIARRTVIRKAKDLRYMSQQDRIRALQLANPKKDPLEIEKAFHNARAAKEMYRNVPSARPANSGGISTIKVPEDPDADPKAPNTTFKSIVDPTEIEHHLLQRNQAHFSQARHTPLANATTTDLLGFGGATSISDRLLQGTISVDAITRDPFGQAILAQCRRINPVIPAGITIDEFKESYKTWRVGTSTSPSGRHLSHQHALFQPHGIDDLTEADDFLAAEKSRDLNWYVQHGIVSYGIKHGYTFDRWKQVVTAMIEKEPGNPQLHRLRVIHLYESDYNSLLGIKMRQVIHKAEDSNSIHDGTYGSRANRQAVDPTFLEVLQYDYATLTRWPEIIFSNDATSCYDRIVPSVSNVIARSMGLHKHIANIHGTMLEQAVYRIKTQLGISTGFYFHSPNWPVYGTGQGSCASPPFWLLNCSAYFKIYESKCYGARYHNIDGSRELKLGMSGFVDDNKCNINSRPEQEDSLCERAQHDAQLWNDILWGSGGALEHSKCSYKYLKTEFTSTGIPYFRGGSFGTPIQIKDNTGHATAIEHTSAYQAYKTLGTYQAATRRQKIQFQMLQKKAVSLLRCLALSTCSPHAAWLYYSSIFMKSIGYPLSVSRLTKSQLTKLQGPMTALTLNRLGYSKSLSRTVVFGSWFYGGLEFASLSTTQGAGKITLLMRHLRTAGPPQTLALIVIDRFQYNAGVGFPILEETRVPLPHLEGVWITTVREYLADINGSLQIAQTTVQPLQRHGDRYIMEVILESKLFQPREIKFLNYCRLYLQILSLSDMYNAQGNAVAVGIYDGYRSVSQSRSTLLEPLQERPNAQIWSLWRRFVRSLTVDGCWVYEPLGPWYPGLSQRRLWPSYFSPTEDTLYRYSCNELVSHARLRSNVFSENRSTYQQLMLPPDAIPVDVSDVDDGWYMFSAQAPIALIPDVVTFPSFQEFVLALPEHESLLLQRFEILCDDIFEVCSCMSTLSDLLLVSDGGAMDDYGSYGWIISTTDGTRLARGSGSTFGYDPRSYRAESQGAKAGTLFILRCFDYCNVPIPAGQFKFYCDNEGLLKKLTYLRSYTNAIHSTVLHSEWDLVSSVHRLHLKFQSPPLLIHVKGHQDDGTPFEFLELPSQLNVEADKLATVEMLEYGSVKPIVPFDPDVGTQLQIDGITVTRQLGVAIHNKQHLPPLRKYYCTRFHWSTIRFHQVDWVSFSMAYKRFPRQKTFYRKLGWKKLPVGARLHQRTPCYDHRCPTCSTDHENDDHLFQCEHTSRVQWRTTFLQQLDDKFHSVLDPDLLAIIRLGLRAYFNNSSPDYSERFPLGYSSTPYGDLICQQTALGWDHFIRGKLSKEWTKVQYQFAKRYGLVKESEGWVTALIKFMATASFQLWELRNKCRHGHDTATRQQSLHEQTHREIRCLYQMHPYVLPQDRDIFRTSVDEHLLETVPQLRNWITHNRKLIMHSVKVAKEQIKMNTHRLQRFFPGQGVRRSSISTQQVAAPPRRHRLTRLSSFFPIISRSRTRPPPLSTVPEEAATTLNAGQRRTIRRRQLNLFDFYPDHPG